MSFPGLTLTMGYLPDLTSFSVLLMDNTACQTRSVFLETKIFDLPTLAGPLWVPQLLQ